MKKLILPIIAFLVFLSLTKYSYAQDYQTSKDCLKERHNAEYECGQIHKACVERCSGQYIDKCIGACFDEEYKCDDVAKAEYDKCLTGQSSSAPTAEPSATSYNDPLIKVPFTIGGWLNIIEWTKKAKFLLFLMKKGDVFTLWGAGQDHSLCDPEDCERTTDKGDENYRQELLERRLREFNGFIDRDNEPWPFLKDVEIGDDGKPILIKTPQGAFEIQPFNNQKAKLEYQGNTPVLKGGQMEVFEENKGPSSTTIETPNAELFIIGTHFLLTYDQKQKYTALAVFDGQVEIKPKGNSVSKVVSPKGDKPGEMFVTSKTSIVKLVMFWLVLAAVIAGIVLLVKRKIDATSKKKK